MRTETKTIAANEIEPKAKRRKFTASYKARIVAEADACKEDGQVGALLRREGLYSSHLCTWRVQARAGTLKALGRKRGPKKKRTEAQRRADELERENARLRAKLKHAEDIIEIQKKLSRILGVQLNPNETQPESDDE
jgi:transposase-like protein